jgi:hypothetical protein
MRGGWQVLREPLRRPPEGVIRVLLVEMTAAVRPDEKPKGLGGVVVSQLTALHRVLQGHGSKN